MSLALRSAYSFTPLPTSRTVIISAHCPLSSAWAGCHGESFLSEGSECFRLISRGQRRYRAPHAANLRPPTPYPPLPSTPPPSCCAPIKAELIKPQLIASAGGEGWRRGREGGREGALQLYIGIYLPFSMYSARLVVTSQCTCLTRAPVPLQFNAQRWQTGSQRGLLLTLGEKSAQGQSESGSSEVVTSSNKGGGWRFAFEQQYVRGRTLSICLSIHTRSSGEGADAVAAPRRADYRGSLAPSPVVSYASPPLPAAIPLPQLPVPALECFCSILNRLIEQCSRERAACQSQLKTQKQKIKKAHG